MLIFAKFSLVQVYIYIYIKRKIEINLIVFKYKNMKNNIFKGCIYSYTNDI